MSYEFKVKPDCLGAYALRARSPMNLGRVIFALFGREGELNPPLSESEQEIVETLRMQAGWYEKAKKKDADRKKKWREIHLPNQNATQSVETTEVQGQSDSPPIRPSTLPSVLIHKGGTVTTVGARKPTLEEIVNYATNVMGIPVWYAEYWYVQVGPQGANWNPRDGLVLDASNYHTYLRKWYNHESKKKLAEIKQDYEENKRIKEAQSKPITVAREDWMLCTERCALFDRNKCGCPRFKIPPVLRGPNGMIPEECSGFVKRPDYDDVH